jgi:hypothetical protein
MSMTKAEHFGAVFDHEQIRLRPPSKLKKINGDFTIIPTVRIIMRAAAKWLSCGRIQGEKADLAPCRGFKAWTSSWHFHIASDLKETPSSTTTL